MFDTKQDKIKLLKKYTNSNELYQHARELIDTLSEDGNDTDLSVNDDYNYGTDYDLELVLEVINNLRDYTNYIKDENYDLITQYDLDYLHRFFL